MYKHYNPNPLKKSAGDCTVRAISKATGSDWVTTYIALCLQGLMHCDMPSANDVWGAYLRSKGYRKHITDEETISQFSQAHKDGVYIVGTGSHVVCTDSGDYWDSWDSGSETVIYYYRKD